MVRLFQSTIRGNSPILFLCLLKRLIYLLALQIGTGHYMENKNGTTNTVYNKLSFAAGVLTVLFGSLILAGWQLNVNFLKTFGVSPVPMKANPALAFFFSGLSLVMLNLKNKNSVSKLMAKSSAAVVFCIGLLTLIEYLFQINFHIDELLFRDTPDAVFTIIPGRMSFNLALGLTSAGIALLLIGTSNQFARAATILSACIGVLAALSYILSLSVLLEMVGVNTIALNSAICLIVLSAGIYFAVPEREYSRSTIEKKSLAAFIAIAMILILSNVLFILLQNKVVKLDKQVAEINKVIDKIDQTLFLAANIESDTRGYVITGDDVFLQMFKKSKYDIELDLQDLSNMTTDISTKHYLDSLMLLLTEKISYCETTISVRKLNGIKLAAESVFTKKDKILMDNIRSISGKMKSVELVNYTNTHEQELAVDKENNSLQIIFMIVLFVFLTLIYFAISRDITERKRIEMEIKTQNEKLSALNAEKDKLFSIIAHDLRSPFTGLMNLTEMMADKSETFTILEYLEYSKSLNDSAQNIYKLINNLFEWAQLQKGSIQFSPQIIPLHKIVSMEIESIILHSKNKFISIKNLVPDSAHIYADENMINSVLRNLIMNSIKFTEPGGCITVNSVPTNNGSVAFSVSDTGIGMSEDYIKKLFKIGEKIGSRGTAGELSTGLGLLLCKEFVDKHNGEIKVKSEEGVGSTFTVILPDNCY